MFFVSHKKHTRAVGLIILTTFFWGFAAPLIKVALDGGATIWQANFIRGVLGMVFLTVLWPRKDWSLHNVPPKARLVFTIAVTLSGLTTVLFAVLASTTSSLNTVTLFMTAPLFSFILEWLIWRTPISRKEVAAFLFLVLGILMTVYSAEEGLSSIISFQSITLGLISGFLIGVTLICFQRVHKIPPKTTTYWTLFMLVLLSMPLGLPDMFVFPISIQGIFALVALGLFVQALANYTLDSAIQYLHPSETAVLESLQIIFVLIAGLMIGEFPSLLQFIGATTIVGSAALIAQNKK